MVPAAGSWWRTAEARREPRSIRTVSRHGYRFVFEHVREAPDGPTARLGRRDAGQLFVFDEIVGALVGGTVDVAGFAGIPGRLAGDADHHQDEPARPYQTSRMAST